MSLNPLLGASGVQVTAKWKVSAVACTYYLIIFLAFELIDIKVCFLKRSCLILKRVLVLIQSWAINRYFGGVKIAQINMAFNKQHPTFPQSQEL